MTPDHLARAYALLFPSRLRKAHLALVAYAEQANPDGWPNPRDVHNFARMYRVPRAQLGGLVGMLCRREPGTRRDAWVDAVRQPDVATPHLIRQHPREVLRAFGWFCHSTDLGWLRLREPVLH
ncbi:MAG: hypothetical protein OIF47_02725 [Marinibacterium sp.]|nr:hypothetical protein [Marinibacterium sp.]